ncbi:MAG: YkgJ family cysteine cluster protein [Candidatus Omnitrophica bacterium]|nr:YkgJ family cysteine cluster protein [Candidatus Omnitrophota bacterium]
MQLKRLIPQEFCLRCDICCRFPQNDTVWTPLFTNSEVKYLVENDILPPLVFTSHPKTKIRKNSCSPEKIGAQRINLIGHKDYFICPCLEPSDYKCKIYADRPLECQLYPFLLTKKEGQFYLAQDKKCPYLDIADETKLKFYINYLKAELEKEDMVSFLKQNQELFVEYPATDLKLLFPIDVN